MSLNVSKEFSGVNFIITFSFLQSQGISSHKVGPESVQRSVRVQLSGALGILTVVS